MHLFLNLLFAVRVMFYVYQEIRRMLIYNDRRAWLWIWSILEYLLGSAFDVNPDTFRNKHEQTLTGVGSRATHILPRVSICYRSK